MSHYLLVPLFDCLETGLLVQQRGSYLCQVKIQGHSGFEPKRCLCRFFPLVQWKLCALTGIEVHNSAANTVSD
jgi:hypothetical protein